MTGADQRPRRIDQWVPALHAGDAIGDSARLLRDALRARGFQSDVYALHLDEGLEGDGRHFADWTPGGPDDVVLLHYAIVSPLTAALKEQRCKRGLIHHNITPPEFFADYDREMAHILKLGREELASLAPHVDLALGDSEFNRRELEQAGFARTGVLPILLDFARYDEAPNPVLLRQLRDGRVNLLFVGRVAPNKRPDALIRVAAYWKRFISPNLRLVLVGKLPRRETGRGEPLRAHYFDTLQRFFHELGFASDEIVFTGHVDHAELLACYRAADVFVCASEHEGFGVPLVEAMRMDVPIVAVRGTAVSDTLGGAGVELEDADPAAMAEAAHLLATDAAVRARVLAGQRRRLQAFAPESVLRALDAHLRSLGAAP
ncbi:MAG: glycosyltransferase family 4 protein [Vicinamibacteria bacterium]|nr:glycosyltransferase family 4 protein [Vicinamibacteria bacterium]